MEINKGKADPKARKCGKCCAGCARGDFVPGSLFGLCDLDGHQTYADDSCERFSPIPSPKEE